MSSNGAEAPHLKLVANKPLAMREGNARAKDVERAVLMARAQEGDQDLTAGCFRTSRPMSGR